ncbi:hypothetical protein EZJ19_06705 [Parasulfuritortus cantonensis]|uniref:Uncharacterized protein n=1 Tax=Parasulfuritortus cantonensis TaxID=2528202 RepID=A0A4R1BEE0_9PROT|nr:magnetosome protein MamC [Parasulfuritortus cantonensis]TCJ15516.1 hypothetical protein EZJ19_06705 [Parasulfuritortus cantonensis]
MSDLYPVSYVAAGTYLPASPPTEALACESLVSMALVGAVVGGSAAAAHNALRVKRDEIQFAEAMRRTGRTAIASAAATVVAGAAANAVAKEGVLRLSLMFGVGAAVLYGMNRWVEEEAHD